MHKPDEPPLLVASRSRIRAQLLENAGLMIETAPADLDEASMLKAMALDDDSVTPEDAAQILASAKALHMSQSNAGRLVLGADQTLSFASEIHQKPKDMDAARRRLLSYSGKTHHLHSAAALVRDGQVIWETVDTADLTMRDLSPGFVGRYLSACGDAALQSVGCYQLEGLGAHLFKEIRGDYFTILGLPLLPLLDALRQEGMIDSA
ncbi:MAG: Maf family protein [Pseudomonadota bacterium]